MIRVLFSKSFYIILLLIVGIVISLIKLNENNDDTKDISINFFVSGKKENLGCVSLYINDEEDNEYSFNDGITWQKSKYGAVYENGKKYILIRTKDNILYSKEIEVNGIISNAPVIKLNFDNNFKNKNKLLEGVEATYDGNSIINDVKTNILEENDDTLLVSYLVEKNGSKCYLLKQAINKNEEEKEIIKWVWPTVSPYQISRGVSDSHNGVDIYGPGRGTFVRAAMDGKVVDISSNSSSGYYVTIKHDNGYYSRYAHLQNTDGNDRLGKTNSALKYISVGKIVKRGDTIGEVGASGNSTAIHLHFEVWAGLPFQSKLLNPLSFYK